MRAFQPGMTLQNSSSLKEKMGCGLKRIANQKTTMLAEQKIEIENPNHFLCGKTDYN